MPVEGEILEDPGVPQLAVHGVVDLAAGTRQALRLTGAQIVEDHFTDDAVSRDVRSDTQGQRSHCHHDETGRLSEDAGGV